MRSIRPALVAVLVLAGTGLVLLPATQRASADATASVPAGAPTLHSYPLGTTAVCADYAASTSSDPTRDCNGHGGVLDWFIAQPASGATPSSTDGVNSAQLDTAQRTQDAAQVSADPVSVQAPGSGSRSYAEHPTGPLNVSAWLDDYLCRGGPVQVSAQVTDDDGNPLPGVTVSGYVKFDTGGSSLGFPPTDANGMTSMHFNSGSPRGGYNVVFSVHAQQGDELADTTTSCYAP